jgi:hypothetical protein
MLFLILLPFIFLFIRQKWKALRNIFQVFIGDKTFVGYHLGEDIENVNLPKLKPGVFVPFEQQFRDLHQANLFYARNYKAIIDLKIVMFNINKLGDG